MKIKLSLLIIAQMVTGSFLYAQEKVKTFVKGDIIPVNMVLGKMVNHKMNKTKFSDFKGKLVILDFWATHCSPCVAGLPRMDSLQRKYGNKIAIIPITSEDSHTIQNYFSHKKFKLPSVVEDKVLSKAFPQTALDLHVWINEKGKLIATTNGEDVNFNTVAEYFKTRKVNAKERIDIITSFNSDRNLFADKNTEFGNEFIGGSILTRAIPGLNHGGGSIKKKDTVKSVMVYNVNPSMLFAYVFSLANNVCQPNRLFVEDERGKFSRMASSSDFDSAITEVNKWMGEEIYCYNSIMPSPGVPEKEFYRKYMLENLNQYFNYTARIEKLNLPCWILIKEDQYKINYASMEEAKQKGPNYYGLEQYNYLKSYSQASVEEFICYLKRFYYMSPPILNETGLSNEKINLDLNMKYSQDKANYKTLNLEEWRAAFQRNGLDIKVEDREVEVMVFKKKETPAK